MKKAFILCILCALLACIAVLPALAEDIPDLAEINAAIAAAETELAEAKAELAEATYAMENAVASRPFAVAGINCTINGVCALSVEPNGESLECTAVVPEGMEFDHWEINGGHAQDGPVGARFVFTDTTVVKAVLREKKAVAAENACIQFLDARGRAKGDKLESFDFSEEYTQPVTNGSCEAGYATVRITEDAPRGKKVTGWRINGVEHHFKKSVSAFTVEYLHRYTVYEALTD